MAQIVFNIDNAKADRVMNAFAGLFPIPTIHDPNFKPEEHPGEEIPHIPQFTKAEWVKECLKMWIIKQTFRWEKIKEQEASTLKEDTTLVQ